MPTRPDLPVHAPLRRAPWAVIRSPCSVAAGPGRETTGRKPATVTDAPTARSTSTGGDAEDPPVNTHRS